MVQKNEHSSLNLPIKRFFEVTTFEQAKYRRCAQAFYGPGLPRWLLLHIPAISLDIAFLYRAAKVISYGDSASEAVQNENLNKATFAFVSPIQCLSVANKQSASKSVRLISTLDGLVLPSSSYLSLHLLEVGPDCLFWTLAVQSTFDVTLLWWHSLHLSMVAI